jgi:ribosome-associated translation inhibitor RaiA
MQIQVNTDKNIDGHEPLAEHVKTVVAAHLAHFSDRISRIEVHLSDENGPKEGKADKRCMMEVRIEGRQPAAVTHHAENLHQAIDGAAEKLKHLLDSTMGKLDSHHR